MSNRLDRQEATGRAFYMPGRGNIFGFPTHSGADYTAATGVPINGIQGFAPGALFFNWIDTTIGGSVGALFVNEGTFASAVWQPIDGTSLMGLYYGSGTPVAPATGMSTMGVLYEYADGTGTSPAATAADVVVFAYTLPANSLDGLVSPQGSSFRGLRFRICGNFATNANNKTVKMIWNPASAVVGSTVGASGTQIATTGVVASSNLGFCLEGEVWKYGAPNSNTQIVQQTYGFVSTGAAGGASKVLTATAVENAGILVAFTANAATTATDIVILRAEILGLN